MTFVFPIADVLTQATAFLTPLLPVAALTVGMGIAFRVYRNIKKS